MKKENRTYKIYIEDILTSIERIQEYVDGLSFDDFILEYKTIDAVIRNFEIIGEASKSIPETIKQINDKIPWDEMYYLRNKIAHEYFGVDYSILWDIIINYLPENKKNILFLLSQLKDSET